MSKLTLQGNTTNTFGRYLPIPRIEKVTINADTSFDLEYAIYIKAETDEALENIVSYLEDNVTMCISETMDWHTTYFNDFIQSGAPEKIFDPFVHGLFYSDDFTEVEFEEFLEDYPMIEGFFESPFNHPLTPTETWSELTPQWVYDDAGIRLAKFVFTYHRSRLQKSYDPDEPVTYYSTWTEPPGGGLVGTYPSWGDFDAIMLYSVDNRLMEYTASEMQSLLFNNPLLVRNMMSDVDWEVLLEQGNVPNRMKMIYIDPDGAPYDDLPLQSVTNQYFKQDTYTYDDIDKAFQTLIGDYDKVLRTSTNAAANSDLKDGLDQISYVLANYKYNVQLIPELNALRTAWPDRNLGAPIGHLYERFRRRLVNVNSTIFEQPILSKELIVNTKVIDGRVERRTRWNSRRVSFGEIDPALGVVVDPALYDYYRDNKVTDDDGAGLGMTLLYPNWKISNYAFTSADALSTQSDAILTNGFYWFDYEKYVNTQSILSDFFPPWKVEQYFSRDMVNMHIRIAGSQLVRKTQPYASMGSLEFDRVNIEANSSFYEFEGPESATALGTPATVVSWYKDMLTAPDMAEDTWGGMAGHGTGHIGARGGGDVYSYHVIRNFALPSDPAEEVLGSTENLDDYRLMCFDFQDVYSKDHPGVVNQYAKPPYEHFYEATVKMRDSSLFIVKQITGSYYEEVSILTDYVELAQEYCSFNDIDNTFNQFFVDHMDSLYTEDSAPYLRAATMYYLHLDLLYDDSGGDLSTLIYKAKTKADEIGPHQGTLPALLKFHREFVGLYETQYRGFENERDALDPSWVVEDIENDFAYRVAFHTTDTIGGMTPGDSGGGNSVYHTRHRTRYGYSSESPFYAAAPGDGGSGGTDPGETTTGNNNTFTPAWPPEDERNMSPNWIQPIWETDADYVTLEESELDHDYPPSQHPKPFSIVACDGYGSITSTAMNECRLKDLYEYMAPLASYCFAMMRRLWQDCYGHGVRASRWSDLGDTTSQREAWANEYIDDHGGAIARNVMFSFMSAIGGATDLFTESADYEDDSGASSWLQSSSTMGWNFKYTLGAQQDDYDALALGVLMWGIAGIKLGGVGQTHRSLWERGQPGMNTIEERMMEFMSEKGAFLTNTINGNWTPLEGSTGGTRSDTELIRFDEPFNRNGQGAVYDNSIDAMLPGGYFWEAFASLCCTIGVNTSEWYVDSEEHFAVFMQWLNLEKGATGAYSGLTGPSTTRQLEQYWAVQNYMADDEDKTSGKVAFLHDLGAAAWYKWDRVGQPDSFYRSFSAVTGCEQGDTWYDNPAATLECLREWEQQWIDDNEVASGGPDTSSGPT